MSDIFQETLLARILGLASDKIRNALLLTDDYRIMKRPKKRGGYRVIYIPPEPLKEIQKKILKRLFLRMWKEGYTWLYGIYRKTSYVQHAQKHQDAKWVFQFDLKDAFPSVNVLSLKGILLEKFLREIDEFESFVSLYRTGLRRLEKAQEEGDRYDIEWNNEVVKEYKKEVSASIFSSTNLDQLMVLKEEDQWKSLWILPQKKEIAQGLTELIMELTIFQGILPQGTPTAPFIFYLVLAEGSLFNKLQSLCPYIYPESQDRYQFQISAYIDNFVISAQKPIPLKIQEELIETVEEFGFEVNTGKTRHQGTIHGAPLITGLRIIKENDEGDEGKVILPKKKIRQLRGLIHGALFDPKLRQKAKGAITSLKPIYGETVFLKENGQLGHKAIFPPQLEKVSRAFLLKLEQEGM